MSWLVQMFSCGMYFIIPENVSSVFIYLLTQSALIFANQFIFFALFLVTLDYENYIRCGK